MSLQHVWSELAQHWSASAESDLSSGTSIAIAPPPGALACHLHETLNRGFLLQIRNIEVHLRVPLTVACGARLRLHHRGWFLRGPLSAVRSVGDADLLGAAERICASARVQENIAQVDFTRFELCGEGDSLYVRLALYGGSELRSPLPGLQRYVRLGPAQTRALTAALHAIAQALIV